MSKGEGNEAGQVMMVEQGTGIVFEGGVSGMQGISMERSKAAAG
jgi:hypothetical protein